jgi:RNA polymerase sigma-70 factor (ECF subfamily)
MAGEHVKPSSSTPESDVRALLSAGDAAGAATAALRSHGPRILRYLRSLLRSEDDAKDAFSMFAEDLWKGLPSFRGDASLQTWMFRLAWCVAQDLRKEPWRRRGRRFATGEASAIAEEISTRSYARDERRRRDLDRLREVLSLEEQTLLDLRIDQHLSWPEIAGVLSHDSEAVHPDALAKRFERLKERLARLAREKGLIE